MTTYAAHTHLCLPIENATASCHPDVFIVPIDRITLGLKDLLENAARLQASLPGFRAIEADFYRGIWSKLGDEVDDCEVFQLTSPLEAGWAAEYNQDDMESAPIEGFAVHADGFGNLEFRCYDADSGEYLWTDTVQVTLQSDRYLITFGDQTFDTLTHELARREFPHADFPPNEIPF